MDQAWDKMYALALERGLTQLAWAMRCGVFDENDLSDRRLIKERLTNRR